MFTRSKATTFVNDLVSASLAIVQDTISKTTENANLTNVISLDGCDNVDISHVDLKQVYTLNLSSFKDFTGKITASQIEEAMTKATADASSKAGLGVFSEADATTIVNSAHLLSTAIAQKIETGLDVTTAGQNGIICNNSKNINISYVTLNQFISKTVSEIVTSSQVASAMQDLKSTVDAASSAKATGMDFSMIIVLILLGLGVLVLGPMAFVKGMLQKKGFWLAIALAATGASGYFLAAPLIKTWPYREKLLCDQKDSDATVKKVGLAAAGSALAVSLIADVVISILMLKESKVV